MHLNVGYATHRGRVRQSNQDSLGVFAPSTGLFNRSGLYLFIVADGMGGHQGGEVASRIAAQTMGDVFSRKSNKTRPGQALKDALTAANDAVLAQSARSPKMKGMGTTVVAATATPEMIYALNVGDSRAYLIRGEDIRQITQDHSLVAEQVRRGELTEEEAEIVTGRNVITRSVGRHLDANPDLFTEAWQPGDILLLCSDGLWGQVSDAQILTVLTEIEDPQAAVEKLIKMAMIAQAPDNVSVIVVKRQG